MSAPTSAQFRAVLKYLLENSITFTDDWLTACYDWIKKSHTSSQLTDDFIQNQVYLQWLDSNLEYMESTCLPTNLKEQRNTILPGNYTLQVNWLQDIGESAFSQYSKIKKLENENTHVEATDSTFVATWQPKPRRSLYMNLTDGSQKIHGLETEPIQTLSLAIKPGSKILIYGPVNCRRGILQLKAKHVKPLGGEVEGFTENSVENILSSILHKDHPPQSCASMSSQPQQNSAINFNTQTSLSFQNRTTQLIGSQNHLTKGVSSAVKTHPYPTTWNSNDGFEDDDALFMDIDEEALLASATPLTPTSNTPSTSFKLSKSTSSKQKAITKLPPANQKLQSSNLTSLSQGGGEDSIAVSRKKSRKQEGILSYLKRSPAKTQRNTTSAVNKCPFDSSDDDFFAFDEDKTKTTPFSDSSPSNSPDVITLDDSPEKPRLAHTKVVAVAAAPYQYIKQITNGEFKVGDTVFVKAIIATLTSNIQVEKLSREWKIHVNINDGTGFLIARIASTVLDEVIGFSPSQMKQLQTSKSPDAKAKIDKGMTQLTTTLIHFNGLMRIKIFQDEKVINQFIEISYEHVHAVSRRLTQILKP